MTKTSATLLWDKIKADLKDWSPIAFAFDAALSLLLSYVFSLVFSIAWYQLVVLMLLTFLTLTTGTLYLEHYRRQRMTRAELEETKSASALDAIKSQMIRYAKANPIDEGSFWDWYQRVLGFLSSVCKREIVGDFEMLADRTKEYAPCQDFLLGLIFNLRESDLRRSNEAAV